MMNFIAEAVTNPAIDVAKLEVLLRMKREVTADRGVLLFNEALHRAQAAMPRVKKNGTIDMGSKGSMKFAKWEDMDTILRPILDAHGFSLSFDTAPRDGGGSVITGTLQHTAGHHRTASMSLPLDSGAGRNNLQAAGSTLSYGKRYVAEMLLNIVREGDDDDGKAGGMVFVTQAEATELTNLVAATGTDLRQFLAMMVRDNVHAIEEIERDDFPRLKNALLDKQSKLKAKGRAA
jgi:hypothetical protein